MNPEISDGHHTERAGLLGADNADNWPAAESLADLFPLADTGGIDLGREAVEQVRSQRAVHRNQRRASGIPVVALVGYTNAGKSTLMNTLTGANVLSSNQLFATLDPTTRRLELPNHQEILLTDTVGFIQKLPT